MTEAARQAATTAAHRQQDLQATAAEVREVIAEAVPAEAADTAEAAPLEEEDKTLKTKIS